MLLMLVPNIDVLLFHSENRYHFFLCCISSTILRNFRTSRSNIYVVIQISCHFKTTSRFIILTYVNIFIKLSNMVSSATLFLFDIAHCSLFIRVIMDQDIAIFVPARQKVEIVDLTSSDDDGAACRKARDAAAAKRAAKLAAKRAAKRAAREAAASEAAARRAVKLTHRGNTLWSFLICRIVTG
jgi:hypothetical protein